MQIWSNTNVLTSNFYKKDTSAPSSELEASAAFPDWRLACTSASKLPSDSSESNISSSSSSSALHRRSYQEARSLFDVNKFAQRQKAVSTGTQTDKCMSIDQVNLTLLSSATGLHLHKSVLHLG